jgi:hypothetical protein
MVIVIHTLHTYVVKLNNDFDSIGDTDAEVLQFVITPTPVNPSHLVSAELRVFISTSSTPEATHFAQDNSQMVMFKMIYHLFIFHINDLNYFSVIRNF